MFCCTAPEDDTRVDTPQASPNTEDNDPIKDFIKKRDDDLNVVLVVATLFSAVAAAFIVYIHPQLQADSGDDSAALLRVLLYKVDSTTFGGDVPQVPSWDGPPRTVVVALVFQYLSLGAAVCAVLLSLIAKQTLSIYASATASVSNNPKEKQRRPGCIASILHLFVFLLSLLLQVAILLIGCGLTVYIWEVNVSVAGIVLFMTILIIPFWAYLFWTGMFSVVYSCLQNVCGCCLPS